MPQQQPPQPKHSWNSPRWALAILLARNGETFVLGSTPIWVRPMVAALAVAREGGVA